MEINHTIHEREVPYDKLRSLGIDKEAFKALPEKVRNDLSEGRLTPLIRIEIPIDDGRKVALPVKLQIAEGKDGQPTLIAFPIKREPDQAQLQNLNLSPYEHGMLINGSPIYKQLTENDEKKEMFLQLDKETNLLFKRPISEVKMDSRLSDIEKVADIELGFMQKEAARNGKPVELNVGGEKVTVGVDLREPNGFKVVKGDMKEWDLQQKIKYDEAHPEYIGLVKTDKNRWEYATVAELHSPDKEIHMGGGIKRDNKSTLRR